MSQRRIAVFWRLTGAREKHRIEPSADRLWWRDGLRGTLDVDRGPCTSILEEGLLRLRSLFP
jgi:hypothetical protein